jgi:hypothetical protein
MGPRCVGGHRRSFPVADQIAWCRLVDGFKLALELRTFFPLLCHIFQTNLSQIITIITPYITSTAGGGVDLGPKIFFLWGSLCLLCLIYAILLIPETKGLTLEQVDRMLEETTPMTSAKWVPHSTYAAEMGMTEKPAPHGVEHVEVGKETDSSV